MPLRLFMMYPSVNFYPNFPNLNHKIHQGKDGSKPLHINGEAQWDCEERYKIWSLCMQARFEKHSKVYLT